MNLRQIQLLIWPIVNEKAGFGMVTSLANPIAPLVTLNDYLWVSPSLSIYLSFFLPDSRTHYNKEQASFPLVSINVRSFFVGRYYHVLAAALSVDSVCFVFAVDFVYPRHGNSLCNWITPPLGQIKRLVKLISRMNK